MTRSNPTCKGAQTYAVGESSETGCVCEVISHDDPLQQLSRLQIPEETKHTVNVFRSFKQKKNLRCRFYNILNIILTLAWDTSLRALVHYCHQVSFGIKNYVFSNVIQ